MPMKWFAMRRKSLRYRGVIRTRLDVFLLDLVPGLALALAATA
jgi:hypothetical protein